MAAWTVSFVHVSTRTLCIIIDLLKSQLIVLSVSSQVHHHVKFWICAWSHGVCTFDMSK